MASINVTDADREQCEQFVRRGTEKARCLTRARILLKLADGWSDQQIIDAFDVSRATIYNVRYRYQEGGLDLVLQDRVQAKRRHALDGEQEAVLIALACSEVPEGHDHWTLRLLREKLIALDVVEHISPATIHAQLKKTRSSPGDASTGASPR